MGYSPVGCQELDLSEATEHTHNVYMSILISQFTPPSPFPLLPTDIENQRFILIKFSAWVLPHALHACTTPHQTDKHTS